MLRCQSCDWLMVTRQPRHLVAGNKLVARGGLFNPRLKLVSVAPNECLRAKITTKKVSINKIFILLC